jgi:proline racemase
MAIHQLVDRSPCGTSTSADGQLWARGQLGLNRDFISESFIGRHCVGD